MNLYFSVIFSCILLFVTMPQAVLASASSAAKRNLQILLNTRACRNCDLSGLDMTRLDLSRTDLQGADLSLATCNLANFSHANLQGATLHGTKMVGVDLEGADLRDADLRGTSLESAFLGDALVSRALGSGDAFAKHLPKKSSRKSTSGRKRPKAVPESPQVYAKKGAQINDIRATRKKKMVGDLNNSLNGKEVPKISALAASAHFPESIGGDVSRVGGAVLEPLLIQAQKKKRRRDVASPSTGNFNERKIIRALQVKKIVGGKGDGFTKNKPALQAPTLPIESSGKQPEQVTKALSPISAGAKRVKPLPPMRHAPAGKIAPATSSSRKSKSPQKGREISRSQEEMFATTEHVSLWKETPSEKKIVGSTDVGKRVAAPQKLLSPQSVEKKNRQFLQLLKTKRCYGCNLAGLDLSGQILVGADLEKADLSGCNLRRADLRKANLKAASLENAQLQNARLDGADLYKASLRHANLSGASTGNTDFGSAQLQDAIGLSQ